MLDVCIEYKKKSAPGKGTGKGKGKRKLKGAVVLTAPGLSSRGARSSNWHVPACICAFNDGIASSETKVRMLQNLHTGPWGRTDRSK